MINLTSTLSRQMLACLFLASAALLFYSHDCAAATQNLLAPPAPVVLTPANGSTTNNNTPPYSGTAQPGSTVAIIVDGVSIGSTTADASGNWSLTPTVPLPDGSHLVKATATDMTGTSPDSNTNIFTIDTTPPAAPIVTSPPNGFVIGDNTPTYSGVADPGSTVTIFVDGFPIGATTANGIGNWSFTPTVPLPDGQHTVSTTASDTAGNTSPNSNTNTFTVDTTAPPAPMVVTPANGSTTNDNTPTYSGTAEPGSTVTIFVDGVAAGTATANASGNWSFTPAVALSNGQHTVRSTATDGAGNVSPNSNTNTFTVNPPTAASVAAAGRVVTAAGRGISKARVELTDGEGQIRVALTNSFGYFRFAEIPAGATIVLSVSTKNHSFSQSTQVLTLTEENDGILFTADEQTFREQP